MLSYRKLISHIKRWYLVGLDCISNQSWYHIISQGIKNWCSILSKVDISLDEKQDCASNQSWYSIISHDIKSWYPIISKFDIISKVDTTHQKLILHEIKTKLLIKSKLILHYIARYQKLISPDIKRWNYFIPKVDIKNLISYIKRKSLKSL